MSLVKLLLHWSSIAMGVLFALYIVAALVMIFWQQPTPSAPGLTVDDDELIANGIRIEQVYDYQEVQFTMRDGEELFARFFPADSQRIVLMVHGVTGSSVHMNEPAGLIRKASNASVYALDLRGHGNSGGTRGDIDYIGQYEDDLADTVVAIRESYPDHELIILGYSMGGAITPRYATQDSSTVDGYVLVAPNLGIDAPTAINETPKEANPDVEPFIYIHVPRIIGIAMFDGAGIRVFNGMPTMRFNLPDNFVNSYSYRAMMNSTPDDYQAGFEAINVPLLIVVGRDDETMNADAFPALISEFSDGKVQIINRETHNGILYSQGMIDAVQNWIPSVVVVN